ncbi:MAG TPA: MFS transporter [Burkholderiales bacterium]|nr:MFS transporter [Burkholderiales bacterium]
MTRRQLGIVLAAGLVFALIFGVRQSVALFISPLNSATGLGIASISLAFACAQLMWGITQPIAGAAADKYGTGRVVAAGSVLVMLGTVLTPHATSTWMLVLLIGVLAAGGGGMAGLGVLMSALARVLPPEKRGIASGMVNAGGSFGQFLVAPLAALLTGAIGWVGALTALGLLSLAIVPLAWVLRGKPSHEAAASGGASKNLRQAVRDAGRDPSFLLLTAGFFVCGFHVAFIATHLPGVVALCGLPPAVGAWSLSLIGLFNIAGSFGAGWAIGRWRMKSVLSVVYAARAAAVLAFVFAPKTAATFLLFAVVLGFTYLSTVPPTVGLVGKLHGTRYMATLFGIVMLSHQVGAFFGAWLGGTVFERTGSYDWLWYMDIMLAIGAALVHMPIREAPPRLRPVLAA